MKRYAELYFDGKFTLRNDENPESKIVFVANVSEFSLKQDLSDPLLLLIIPKDDAGSFARGSASRSTPRDALATTQCSDSLSPDTNSRHQPITRAKSSLASVLQVLTPRTLQGSVGTLRGEGNGLSMKLHNVSARRSWMSSVAMRQSLIKQRDSKPGAVSGMCWLVHRSFVHSDSGQKHRSIQNEEVSLFEEFCGCRPNGTRAGARIDFPSLALQLQRWSRTLSLTCGCLKRATEQAYYHQAQHAFAWCTSGLSCSLF